MKVRSIAYRGRSVELDSGEVVFDTEGYAEVTHTQYQRLLRCNVQVGVVEYDKVSTTKASTTQEQKATQATNGDASKETQEQTRKDTEPRKETDHAVEMLGTLADMAIRHSPALVINKQEAKTFAEKSLTVVRPSETKQGKKAAKVTSDPPKQTPLSTPEKSKRKKGKA